MGRCAAQHQSILSQPGGQASEVTNLSLQGCALWEGSVPSLSVPSRAAECSLGIALKLPPRPAAPSGIFLDESPHHTPSL